MPRTPKLAAAALLWALLAAGCGPGVGGTGTGGTLSDFGARPASVCTNAIASALACAGSAPGSPGVATPATIEEGTALVHFADRESGASVRVAFAANAVELDVPCRMLRFSGDFGITATSDARFFGTYVDGAAPGRPASLQVTATAGDAPGRLLATLRDADGRIVLGPVTLQRVGAPAAPQC